MHISLIFSLWVECPNWDSLWQTCIIQTASGTAALTLLLFALNNLQSQLLHLARAWRPANVQVAKWRVLCDCVTHLLFGLCNIDAWLQQVGRHLDGDFNFLVYKSFSSLSVGQVCFDLFASERNKVEREEMRMEWWWGGRGRGIHRPCGCGILNLMCVCHQIGKKSLTNVFTGFFLWLLGKSNNQDYNERGP